MDEVSLKVKKTRLLRIEINIRDKAEARGKMPRRIKRIKRLHDYLKSLFVYKFNDPDGRILIPTWKSSTSENVMKTSQGFFIGTIVEP